MTPQVMPTIRHLAEIDDLRAGRDGELQPGQESYAQQIAADLAVHLRSQGISRVVFVHSPKKRALHTAQMAEKFLHEIAPGIQIRYYSEPNLQDIHHGTYILPEGYKAGDYFEGFALADKIFYGEVFGEPERDTENYTYRYGDPVRQDDGSFKYPDLANYFSHTGENFKEASVRIYSEVLKFISDYKRYYQGYEPIVFSHGLPLEVCKDLSEVAKEVVTEGLTFAPGKLPRICFRHSVVRGSEEGSHGRVDLLPLTYITDPKFLKRLQAEIMYLNSIK